MFTYSYKLSKYPALLISILTWPDIRLIHQYKRKPQKNLFLSSPSTKALPYPPSSLAVFVFGEHFFRASKSSLFLVARPLPSPLLVVGPLQIFIAASQAYFRSFFLFFFRCSKSLKCDFYIESGVYAPISGMRKVGLPRDKNRENMRFYTLEVTP